MGTRISLAVELIFSVGSRVAGEGAGATVSPGERKNSTVISMAFALSWWAARNRVFGICWASTSLCTRGRLVGVSLRRPPGQGP